MNITNEDNMQLMSRYEDNYFDLAIVDPPYGVDINSSGTWMKNHDNKKWDKNIPNVKYFNELKRVSKNQIIWGGNYFTEHLPPNNNWIIWHKMNDGMSFSMCEMAHSTIKKNIKLFTLYSNKGRFKKPMNNGVKKIHPTQKPVKLYEWLLMNYAKEGDKILDTHLGSGSIAIACHNLKYDLTACELDKEYYEAAMERIERHKQQLTMF